MNKRSQQPDSSQCESPGGTSVSVSILVFCDTEKAQRQALGVLQAAWRRGPFASEYNVCVWRTETLTEPSLWEAVLKGLRHCDVLFAAAEKDEELLQAIERWNTGSGRAQSPVGFVVAQVEQATDDEVRKRALDDFVRECEAAFLQGKSNDLSPL